MWRLQLGLQEGAPPVVLKVIFDRDEGYEPPQGVIRIVEDEMQVADTDAVNRWELGEDPDAKSERTPPPPPPPTPSPPLSHRVPAMRPSLFLQRSLPSPCQDHLTPCSFWAELA